VNASKSSQARVVARLGWLVGGAVLVAVILVAFSVSEARVFSRLLTGADPRFLLPALLLQGGTYFSQAEIFGTAPRAAGFPVPRSRLLELSLSKLFLDQTLPTAGLGSTAVVAAALVRCGVPRPAVAAGAVLNFVSYQAAYGLMLLAALAIFAMLRGAGLVLVLAIGLLSVFSLSLAFALLSLAGRRPAPGSALPRLPLVRGLLSFIADADVALTRGPRWLAESVLWQMLIFLLDTGTLWLVIRSLGAVSPPVVVFTSLMISSLFRVVGFLPGGLGTYEASSVLTLKLMGVGVPIALAATLIFRLLTFWAPMLPGFWFSRRALGR